MTKFAKIFETPETQVLIFLGDDDDGHPSVQRFVGLHGMLVGVHLTWPNDSDESRSLRNQCFDDFDQSKAEELVSQVKSLLANN